MWSLPPAVHRNHDERFLSVLRLDDGSVAEPDGAHRHLAHPGFASVRSDLFKPSDVDTVGEFHDTGWDKRSQRVLLTQPVGVWTELHLVGDVLGRITGLL